MMRSPRAACAIALIVGTALVGAGAGAAPKAEVKPLVYNEDSGPNDTGVSDRNAAVATWKQGEGIDGGFGLLLEKKLPTGEYAAAIGNITKVKGEEVQTLAFTVRADAYCGAGAPRFSVLTEDPTGYNVSAGCSYGDPTEFTDEDGVAWVSRTFAAADFGLAGEHIEDIFVIQDEQGATVLDDITVNDRVVGKPGRANKKNR